MFSKNTIKKQYQCYDETQENQWFILFEESTNYSGKSNPRIVFSTKEKLGNKNYQGPYTYHKAKKKYYKILKRYRNY